MTGHGTESDPAGPAGNAIDERTWAAAIGPRCLYYLPRFERFAARGTGPTWHWGAFFFTFWWLIYRKLWLPALLYWMAWMAVSQLDTLLEQAGFAPILSPAALVISFTFVPMYANALYFHATRRTIQRVYARIPDDAGRLRELERAGGTSLLAFLGIALLAASIAAAVLIPAHRDITARRQVGEAVSLTYRFKVDLAAHYAAEAGFDGIDPESPGYDTSGEYVESISFARTGPAALAVVATFRATRVEPPLRAREFRIATLDGGATWQCGAAITDPALRGDNQVEARLLPEACR